MIKLAFLDGLRDRKVQWCFMDWKMVKGFLAPAVILGVEAEASLFDQNT